MIIKNKPLKLEAWSMASEKNEEDRLRVTFHQQIENFSYFHMLKNAVSLAPPQGFNSLDVMENHMRLNKIFSYAIQSEKEEVKIETTADLDLIKNQVKNMVVNCLDENYIQFLKDVKSWQFE